MKFYHHPASTNCRKVEAVLLHTGLEAERIQIDLAKGEQNTPQFLAINPNAKVPALVDGDVKLWESNAIMGYLCTKADSDLWPRSNIRYEILRWMFWELAHFGPPVDTIVFERVVKPSIGVGETDESKVAKAQKGFLKATKVLDSHLANQFFIVGEKVTIADLAVASHLTYEKPAKLELSDYTHVRTWLERLLSIPAWAKTAPQD